MEATVVPVELAKRFVGYNILNLHGPHFLHHDNKGTREKDKI